MTIHELSKEQITQLKQAYYISKHPDGVSYEDLAAIDTLVTAAELVEEYEGVIFSADDFIS
jgi:hypothetical protein